MYRRGWGMSKYSIGYTHWANHRAGILGNNAPYSLLKVTLRFDGAPMIEVRTDVTLSIYFFRRARYRLGFLSYRCKGGNLSILRSILLVRPNGAVVYRRSTPGKVGDNSQIGNVS